MNHQNEVDAKENPDNQDPVDPVVHEPQAQAVETAQEGEHEGMRQFRNVLLEIRDDNSG